MYVIPYSCRYLFIENLYFKKKPDYMETENKVVIFTFRDSKYNSNHPFCRKNTNRYSNVHCSLPPTFVKI